MIDVLIHTANALFLGSYLVRDILWLRVLSIAAGLCLLSYFAAESPPVLSGIAWQVLFLVINGMQIAVLIAERRPVAFSADELLLSRLAFRALAPREFKKLAARGQWRALAKGQVLVKDGEFPSELTAILHGHVDVHADGRTLATLGPGQLVGEMSLLSGRAPTANAVVSADVRALCWDQKELRAFLDKEAHLRASLQLAIGEDLTEKLRAA